MDSAGIHHGAASFCKAHVEIVSMCWNDWNAVHSRVTVCHIQHKKATAATFIGDRGALLTVSMRTLLAHCCYNVADYYMVTDEQATQRHSPAAAADSARLSQFKSAVPTC